MLEWVYGDRMSFLTSTSGIREEMLESDNLFSGSLILPPYLKMMETIENWGLSSRKMRIKSIWAWGFIMNMGLLYYTGWLGGLQVPMVPHQFPNKIQFNSPQNQIRADLWGSCTFGQSSGWLPSGRLGWSKTRTARRRSVSRFQTNPEKFKKDKNYNLK